MRFLRAHRTRLFPAFLAVLVVVALVLPFVNSPYAVQNYTRILILAVGVVGLNMLTGYGGVVSLGHGAFFGIGAYTSAILIADVGWPWYAAFVPSMVAAFAAGALVGIPALRIRGLHLAIVTLALGALFPYLVTRFSDLTAGNQGKVVPTMRAPDWLPLERDQVAFLVCLLALVLAMAASWALGRSRTGRALLAMRENEIAATMVGVDVARLKVVVFGLSASFAGAAGALFVSTQGVITSETSQLTLFGSITYLAALVIGGATTVLGPLVGAVIAQELPELLSDLDPVLAPVIYGVLLIVVIFFLPRGIVGELGRRARAVLAERPADGPRPRDGTAGTGPPPRTSESTPQSGQELAERPPEEVPHA